MAEEVQKQPTQVKTNYRKTNNPPSFETAINAKGQIYIKAVKSGQTPKELKGTWTSKHEAQQAIDVYTELRTKN